MSISEQVDEFFRSTRQRVFIEAEAKESTMMNFIREYNSKYSARLSISDDGIISLDDAANKWGLELRCYFDDRSGFPSDVITTSNQAYRIKYPYRFNSKDVIWGLFDLGYRIGIN